MYTTTSYLSLLCGNMSSVIDGILTSQLFDLVPFRVSVIDRDYNVVAANRRYVDAFGEYQNKNAILVANILMNLAPNASYNRSLKQDIIEFLTKPLLLKPGIPHI